VKDRHISLRPAPDTMTRFSALLPVAQGVAVYALRRSADTAVGVGDGRTRGQAMADELVFRVTGQTITGCDSYGAPIYGSTPAKGDPGIDGTSSRDDDRSSEADSRTTSDGPVDCNGADNSGANGPVPAALARALVIGNADTTTKTWIRRLYTDPAGSQLAAMDSKQGYSPPPRRSSCSCVTKPAAPPGATPPSATPTTSPRTTKADPPAPTTVKDSAKPATSPNKHPTGEANPNPTAPSAPPPPPDTP